MFCVLHSIFSRALCKEISKIGLELKILRYKVPFLYLKQLYSTNITRSEHREKFLEQCITELGGREGGGEVKGVTSLKYNFIDGSSIQRL